MKRRKGQQRISNPAKHGGDATGFCYASKANWKQQTQQQHAHVSSTFDVIDLVGLSESDDCAEADKTSSANCHMISKAHDTFSAGKQPRAAACRPAAAAAAAALAFDSDDELHHLIASYMAGHNQKVNSLSGGQGSNMSHHVQAATISLKAVQPPSTAVPGVKAVQPPSEAEPGVKTVQPPSAAEPGVKAVQPPSAAEQGVETVQPPSAAELEGSRPASAATATAAVPASSYQQPAVAKYATPVHHSAAGRKRAAEKLVSWHDLSASCAVTTAAAGQLLLADAAAGAAVG